MLFVFRAWAPLTAPELLLWICISAISWPCITTKNSYLVVYSVAWLCLFDDNGAASLELRVLTLFDSLGLLEYMLPGPAQVSDANRCRGAWRVLLSVLRWVSSGGTR